MRENIVVSKSFEFAIKIVELNTYLINNKNQFVLAKQILRSGTSIGANVKEAVNGISKADFRNKMSIALKEANETEYWLELIIGSKIISRAQINVLLSECRELCKILNSIVKNTY